MSCPSLFHTHTVCACVCVCVWFVDLDSDEDELTDDQRRVRDMERHLINPAEYFELEKFKVNDLTTPARLEKTGRQGSELGAKRSRGSTE